MSPDRSTVLKYAALSGVPLLLLMVWVTVFFLAPTKGNTDEIRAAQDEAKAATVAAQRNGAISACQGEYARTEAGWLAEVTQAFAVRDAEAAAVASANQQEMNGRALGVVELARRDVDEPFVCPPIPDRLARHPLDPREPDPTPLEDP